MFPIIRRSSFLYCTHILTFSLMGPLQFHKPQAIEMMGVFLPLWLSSSVLWSEREESYAFLRTLPVTDREIVRIKFGIILVATVVYWLLMSSLAFLRRGGAESFAALLTFITVICGFSLLLAAGWQVAVWHFGQSIMTRAILAFMGLNFVVAIVFLNSVKRGLTSGPSGLTAIHWIAGAPWEVQALLCALVLAVFFSLMEAAVRVKTSSEAHLWNGRA
jgi:hypothetical protein